jgi:hypothetical protein
MLAPSCATKGVATLDNAGFAVWLGLRKACAPFAVMRLRSDYGDRHLVITSSRILIVALTL